MIMGEMKISPSILDADFKNLQQEIDSIKGADRIHLDIMDGQYVPNLSFGPPVLADIDYGVETEAHLMVNNPENFFEMFQRLGVLGITFHIENTGRERALGLLKQLKSSKIRAGISIDGYTSPDFLSDEILDIADQVLVMSVKAGFGGQSFMPESIEKIKNLRARGFSGEIEVDGGVTLDNVDALSEAGADIVVVGSFLMRRSVEERNKIIRKFQEID